MIDFTDIKMAKDMNGDAANIKPCPFCGSHDIAYVEYQHKAGNRWAITCMNCMAQIDPGWAQSWGSVQELWNHRVETDKL